MDSQRLVITSALAVVAYLLVLAWNEDYGQPVSQQRDQVTSDQVTTLHGESESNELPASKDAPADLPSAESPQAQSLPLQPAQQPNQLISVETDTLIIQIDPRGGDVVRAALKKYPMTLGKPDVPFVVLEQSNQVTYIAQSGLVGLNGPDASNKGRPVYTSSQNSYVMEDGKDNLVVDLMLIDASGVTITKRFTFVRGNYLMDIDFIINNQSSGNWQGNFFAQLKRDNSSDPSQTTSMGMSSFLGAATTTENDPYTKIAFSDFSDDPLKEKMTGGWIAILQHYFLSAWIPDKSELYTYQTRKSGNGDNIAGLIGQKVTIAPSETRVIKAQLFVGPKIQNRLAEISPGLELTVDYGWLWFIAQPLFWLLTKLHGFVGNWGWAIVLTTLAVKLLFFHLSATSYRSMANMRRVGPEMQRLKTLHGDDKQKLSASVMALYKKEKINPLGGCLPILVQMPVFIALYWVLLESVELRHAPFALWITDLSVKDPYFILPILMGGSMFIQQTLNPEPPDPMQARIMKILPIMFTFFFLWFPAGLVLYWVVNNLLSIAQQWVITRQIENAGKIKPT
jgi:YidC/Oxa1 family membrane protein insertase